MADLQEAETFRRRERKYLQQMVVLSAEYEPRAKGPTITSMWAKLKSEQPGRGVSEEGATNPRWTRRLSFNADLRGLGGRDEGGGLALARGCRENRLRRILHHPARPNGRGCAKTVKRVHAVLPMKTAPRHAKASRQASEGTPICDMTRTT